jgi:uncharacterized repeat protein (TIGR01451 family)
MIPFVGGSYQLKRKKADTQRVINLLVTNVESGSGKSKQFLKSIPGLTVFTRATLGITKTQELETAAVGDTQTYTVTATNLGPEAAVGATVADTLPAGISFASCSLAYSGGAAGPATATEAEMGAGVLITAWPAGGVVTMTVVGVFTAEGSILNTAVAAFPGIGGTTVQATTTTTVTPPPACDPYFNNVVLLLHGRGVDGSSAVTDSSKYLDHKTAPAGLTISTDQAKFGTTSLKTVYRDVGEFVWEADRFIRLPGVPYTIEFWFRHVTSVNFISSPLIYRHMQNGVVQSQVSQYSTGNNLSVTGDIYGYTGGDWVFGALAYDGADTATFYIDGVATVSYGGGASGSIDGKFYVLGFSPTPGTEPIEFYLQELRVTNGVNRYPANFTPPTEPFPDIECP